MEVIMTGGWRLPTAADHVDLQNLVKLPEAETTIKDLLDGRSESADCRQRPPSACPGHTEKRHPYSRESFPSLLAFSAPLRRLRGRRK
eukprot:15514315-Heterocapsa_arctica.AAC.1